MSETALESHTFSTAAEKKRILARLARVEGQLRGVQRMIDRDEECEKVVQQMAAARSALNRAFFELIACAFGNTLESPSEDPHEKLTTLSALLAKYA